MASSLDHNHTLNGDSNTQQWPPPPAIIGLGASNSTPRVGFFRHSNPKLGEQLLYFILSSLRGPIQSAKLINVGQKQDALQSLHDLITSKRYRAWQKPLEKIMFKYVELCVDLRKGRFAKDGLIQYRIICQQVNVSSLEEVIKHFMHLSTEKAEQARTQAQALEEALDVDDLKADKRPEDLMLSYVSGEKGKDRSDREVVTPWFKFLWETYRTVLEILRNNSKLEALYATRAASHLELENEKERNLRMANLIGFNLDPKIDRGDVIQLIIVPQTDNVLYGQLSRFALLSELVSKGVLSCATQEVKDLFHLLEHEFLPLDLAVKIQPLLTKISKFGGKLASASSVPEVQLSQYVPALEKLGTLRLLQQVSRVYQSMKIEHLSRMIPFYDFSVVEKIYVDAVKHNFIAMKVDHMKGVMMFGNLICLQFESGTFIPMWSNLAHEMTAEFRGLCAEEAYLQQELEKLHDLRNKVKLEGEHWDDLVSSSSQNSHLVSKATRLWESILASKTMDQSSQVPYADVLSVQSGDFTPTHVDDKEQSDGSYVNINREKMKNNLDSSHSQVNDETLHRADERSGRVHPTVDVAEIIRRWTHTLQRIHKQSLHMAKANEGEGPEILRSAHEGSSSGHAESLAATLAEHQQHLVSFQVLINQLKEVAPAIQKSISEWTDKVDSISSNLPPMIKHPGQMEKVTIKAL
ncbi:putative proteasome component (PCI) domain-containing protein [Rosa chinensis]|uniref:Putative proteasome component (PCI) domain-containing protein n=1 Tax=Rosa chinensis TaxID=74649 RepID=A0A2P6RPC8_ROSCH|nr:putative proteasome component (PCI) domain-containing protein [Rosa chinensis]